MMAMRKTLFGLLAAALLAAPGSSSAVEEDGNFIEIPGFGRIPLPPSLGGEPAEEPPLREAPKKPPRAAAEPVKKLTPAQAQAKVTEQLAARLQAASDSSEAEAILALLRQALANTTSDTSALIATRAATAEKANAPALALALLDRLVATDPAWSEGFVRRAQLRLAEGDASGARADFEAALRLDPRRFDALTALGSLKEEAGDKKGALDAYRHALALAPKLEGLRRTEQRLRVEVEGREI